MDMYIYSSTYFVAIDSRRSGCGLATTHVTLGLELYGADHSDGNGTLNEFLNTMSYYREIGRTNIYFRASA